MHNEDTASTPSRSTHLGLTNLETAEKRRRIAEIAWEIAQLRDESTRLKDELKTDKERFPR